MNNQAEDARILLKKTAENQASKAKKERNRYFLSHYSMLLGNAPVIIILQSGFAFTFYATNTIEAGSNDYIASPFGQPSLLI